MPPVPPGGNLCVEIEGELGIRGITACVYIVGSGHNRWRRRESDCQHTIEARGACDAKDLILGLAEGPSLRKNDLGQAEAQPHFEVV